MLLEVICTDPKRGDVKYFVSPFVFTPEALKTFWEKSSKYPVLFGEDIRQNFDKFSNIFIGQSTNGEFFSKGLVWRIDTETEDLVGVFFMTDFNFPCEATVHFNFLDGRIRGRVPLAKEMLKYVFERYEFERLNASLPTYVKGSARYFIRELGFMTEGKKRNAAKFDDKLWDVIQYGILKSEVLNGS